MVMVVLLSLPFLLLLIVDFRVDKYCVGGTDSETLYLKMSSSYTLSGTAIDNPRCWLW